MHGERVAQGLALVALVAASLFLTTSPASAHADLIASSPSDGAVLDVSPNQVVLKFTEPVELKTAAVNVETAMQQRVLATKPARWRNDPTALVVPVAKKLNGSYVVFWRVTGPDSHVISGAYSFGVFAAGAEGTSAIELASVTQSRGTPFGVAGALTVARGVTYGALSGLVGGVFLLVVVWPAGAQVRRMRRFLWTALGVVAVATGLSASLAYAIATGRGVLSALDPTQWIDSTTTHFGWIAAVRLLLLVLAAILLADLESGVRDRSAWWLIPAVIVGVALVRTPGLVDHGATASPLESLAYLLHMGAIAVWVGGLLVIALVLLPGRSEIDELRPLLLRFSAVATAGLAVIVVSGVVLASPLVGNWRSVPSSEYGQLLLTKLVLVGLGVVFASRVRAWVHGRRSAHMALRNLTAEAVLVVAVIAVTAVLVGRNPSVGPVRSNPSTSITQKGTSVVIPPS